MMQVFFNFFFLNVTQGVITQFLTTHIGQRKKRK